MDKLISAIQDWPALLQGAIGSGIFWLILIIGKRAFTVLLINVSEISKRQKESYLRTQILRCKAGKEGGTFEGGAYYSSTLMFRALRDVINGLIWLSLGLITSSILPIGGIVGFIGCLYYLLSALEVVLPIESGPENDLKIIELESKLTKIMDRQRKPNDK